MGNRLRVRLYRVDRRCFNASDVDWAMHSRKKTVESIGLIVTIVTIDSAHNLDFVISEVVAWWEINHKNALNFGINF